MPNFSHLKIRADVIHDMVEIDEEENILMHQFIVIRPVGMIGGSAGSVRKNIRLMKFN